MDDAPVDKPVDGGVDAATAPAAASAAPSLVEPARAQLLALAADVLGRLDTDDVPPGLRRIARFAPAKRQRLGGVAIAAVLDADPQFRRHVAAALETAAGELVAAVRTGGDTAASDPVDVAVVAYLERPSGWTELLDVANRRWQEQRDAGHAAAGELAALRAELAELRARLRGEAARLREATTAGAAAAEADLAEARRTVRDRTRELRAAERARDDACALVASLESQRRGQDEAHAVELRRLRARVTELERAAETSRRDARTERDVDDARLWLLVDTLVQAASGVRRELSLPAPTTLPADTVSASDNVSQGHAVRDVVSLERVLALPHTHLVVDGYNVTKTGYGDLPLVEQRTRLIGALAALAAQSGVEVTIAFDGGAKPPLAPPTPRGVRVLFSAADEIADDLIRRLVAAEPPGRPVVVVTSDRAVATDTGRDGAWTVPSAVLLARLG